MTHLERRIIVYLKRYLTIRRNDDASKGVKASLLDTLENDANFDESSANLFIDHFAFLEALKHASHVLEDEEIIKFLKSRQDS